MKYPFSCFMHLNKTKGKKKEAAELLGWGRNTLSRKIKELGIEN